MTATCAIVSAGQEGAERQNRVTNATETERHPRCLSHTDLEFKFES
jgi:hypothetical protein